MCLSARLNSLAKPRSTKSYVGTSHENLTAQMLASAGRELYYHTWQKENSTHYYEIDFLISEGTEISAVEVKSSGIGKHESITKFRRKTSGHVKTCYLLSQKDTRTEGDLKMKPLYLTPFFI
jgi:predicted AAA+ superfamily ATPase